MLSYNNLQMTMTVSDCGVRTVCMETCLLTDVKPVSANATHVM